MKKSIDNKGFSLVELIIVMAIIAVLIGILAPTYLKYVERTKRTTDCSTIGTVMDACEVLAADPYVYWAVGTAGTVTLVIDTNKAGHASSFGPATAEVVEALEKMISPSNVSLDSNWGPFTIYASCDASNHVIFDIANNDQIAELEEYSQALANRLE